MQDLTAQHFQTLDELSAYIRSVDPNILLPDGFMSAFVGLVQRSGCPVVAAYDYQRALELLVRQLAEENKSLTEEELQIRAAEHLDFNVFGSYVGPYTWGACEFCTQEEREEFLTELQEGWGQVLLLEGLDDALVGSFTLNCASAVALYDLDTCLRLLPKQGFSSREASLQELARRLEALGSGGPALFTPIRCSEAEAVFRAEEVSR